jgi:hypothetical protein
MAKPVMRKTTTIEAHARRVQFEFFHMTIVSPGAFVLSVPDSLRAFALFVIHFTRSRSL